MRAATIQQFGFRRLAGEATRMLESRPPAPRRNTVPQHPIRREEKEFRDTTFRQGAADYRRRHRHWASNRAGVYAGRRERDSGGTVAGKAPRCERRSPEAGWRAGGARVRREPRQRRWTRRERNSGGTWAAADSGG